MLPTNLLCSWIYCTLKYFKSAVHSYKEETVAYVHYSNRTSHMLLRKNVSQRSLIIFIIYVNLDRNQI